MVESVAILMMTRFFARLYPFTHQKSQRECTGTNDTEGVSKRHGGGRTASDTKAKGS